MFSSRQRPTAICPAASWLPRLIGIWSARLAIYLLLDRVLGHPEEGRYRTLREKWGAAARRRLFFFFQTQALAALFFALPVLVVAHHPVARWTAWDLAGVMIWCVSVGNTILADRQLARFKRRPESRGKTCREGWWRYSRHPNYFFEWLHWWSYVALAVGASYWWLTLLAPAVMLFFLLRVTGIPPTEAQALASRGEDYRRVPAHDQRVHPLVSEEGKRSLMDLIDLAERAILPDWLIRVGHPPAAGGPPARGSAGEDSSPGESLRQFVEELRRSPIAIATDAANVQHYEVPAEFFQRVLGPRLKYSSLLLAPAEHDLAGSRRCDARSVLPAGRDRGRHGDPGTRLRMGLAVPVDRPAVSPLPGPGGFQFADPARVHRVAMPRPGARRTSRWSRPTWPTSEPSGASTGWCPWRCSSTSAITRNCCGESPVG